MPREGGINMNEDLLMEPVEKAYKNLEVEKKIRNKERETKEKRTEMIVYNICPDCGERLTVKNKRFLRFLFEPGYIKSCPNCGVVAKDVYGPMP